MKQALIAIILLLSLMAQAAPAGLSAVPAEVGAPSFRDTTLTDDERIDLLLKELTLDEKIGLLGVRFGVARLGIPECGSSEGLHGLERYPASHPSERNTEKLYTTIFPQAYGLGETWDTDLLRRIGSQVGDEARYYTHRPGANRGVLLVYAPNADLGRDPRWGRTEECFGEDSFLTSRLTVAKIKGLQGDNPRYWKTAALMKHFLANSNEFGRDSTSSNFDSRLFREYYSYPFYKGITEGGSRAFMTAYNSWNGIPMVIHPCLDSIVRKEWGHDGIICTDGGAASLLVSAHKAFPTRAEADAAIIKAGVGQFLDRYQESVNEALEKGYLTEADIDRAIRGNLKVALRLGLLDGPDSANPYPSLGDGEPPYLRPEAKALAREAVVKSVVLLKNDDKTLPLNPQKIKKLLVIGPYADLNVYDWYSGLPPYEVTILQGIRDALAGTDVEVVYAPDNYLDLAMEEAKDADAVIVATGNHPYGTKADWKFCPVPSDGREAVDRRSLQLPDEDMVRQLHSVNPNTILLLVSSFPYAINWSAENLPAILHVTHCAQELGNGVADILFGKANPAGRTTQTWPRDILYLPPMLDYDITHGRTYMYSTADPLFPFGYGLSYSDFEYSDLRSSIREGILSVKFKVRNTGGRDGEEVPQLYVRVGDEPFKLKGFDRVAIPAGKIMEMTLSVPVADLGPWDESTRSFTPAPGTPLEIAVGASSDDIRLRGSAKI